MPADGMILRDADFRVVDVNPAYERMSGYSREKCSARTASSPTRPS